MAEILLCGRRVCGHAGAPSPADQRAAGGRSVEAHAGSQAALSRSEFCGDGASRLRKDRCSMECPRFAPVFWTLTWGERECLGRSHLLLPVIPTAAKASAKRSGGTFCLSERCTSYRKRV